MKLVQISPMKYKAARLAHAMASAAGTKTTSIVGMVSSAIESSLVAGIGNPTASPTRPHVFNRVRGQQRLQSGYLQYV
jgi:hypothetical protein